MLHLFEVFLELFGGLFGGFCVDFGGFLLGFRPLFTALLRLCFLALLRAIRALLDTQLIWAAFRPSPAPRGLGQDPAGALLESYQQSAGQTKSRARLRPEYCLIDVSELWQ